MKIAGAYVLGVASMCAAFLIIQQLALSDCAKRFNVYTCNQVLVSVPLRSQ